MSDPAGLLDPNVLAVDDLQRQEFAEVRNWLRAHVTLKVVPDLNQALRWLSASKTAPVVVVLFQSHPGQYRAEAVGQLRHRAPLIRLIALLGSWCEGELRSGTPLAGVYRTYWYDAVPRLALELARFRSGRSPLWGLPPTATEEERWLRLDRSTVATGNNGLVALCATEQESAEALADVCRQFGYATVWIRPGLPVAVNGAAACLVDLPRGPSAGLSIAPWLRQKLGRVGWIALVSFPRFEDYRQLLDAGYSVVLNKPFVADELLWQIDRITHASR